MIFNLSILEKPHYRSVKYTLDDTMCRPKHQWHETIHIVSPQCYQKKKKDSKLLDDKLIVPPPFKCSALIGWYLDHIFEVTHYV